MRILVCVDGEPHSAAAIEQAINLGLSDETEVTALHVVDPWTKQFYDEIYAQGRREYLEYVEKQLQEISNTTKAGFLERCHAAGLRARFNVRRGDPLEEILAEANEASPDLIVTGGKPSTVWRSFFAADLPTRLRRKLPQDVSLLSVNA